MDTNKIIALISSNALAAKFFEKLSLRKNNANDTTVDSVLAWALKEVPATRKEVVALFKKLEELGAGRFIEGRRGKTSRLKWKLNVLELAKLASSGATSQLEERHDTETTSGKSLESIQAFFTEKGIVSGIFPDSEGSAHLLATIPFGAMWAELTAKCEKEGAQLSVSLPIFPAGAPENVESTLVGVNRGLRHGRFFLDESNLGVHYALKAESVGRTFGQEEARDLFETTHMEVSQNIVPILLAAARWGEGPTDMSLAA